MIMSAPGPTLLRRPNMIMGVWLLEPPDSHDHDVSRRPARGAPLAGLRQWEWLGWTGACDKPCAGPRGETSRRTQRRRGCPLGAGEPQVAGAQRAGAPAVA